MGYYFYMKSSPKMNKYEKKIIPIYEKKNFIIDC
jgi:hypothetical protein